MKLFDTIAAISTPHGEGGISIIRISGNRAIEIADKIFVSSKGKRLSEAKTHTIHHGHIKNSFGKTIDEVLVSVMRAPNTYTCEDIVEINCHGGVVSTKQILLAVLEGGATHAAPGEFTKRAFLNGRIDLCEAESVIDIINSKTNLSHEVSVNQLEGHLSEKINGIREKILALTGHVQVLIDYPEEDLEPLTDAEFQNSLKDIAEEIKKLIETADRGKLIKNGIQTAIVGKPNVGKSSLLNMLSGENRAIVTDIEGTTRDAIEQYINLGDVELKIIDTAGIRETGDIIENIGVEKSKEYIQSSQLVIFVTDGQKALDKNDKYIIENLEGKKTIVLVNKCENGCVADVDYLKSKFDNVILFSVHNEIGTDELCRTVKELFDMGDISNTGDAVITNIRHKDALSKALLAMENAYNSTKSGIPADMTFIDLENAISALGEIVGLTVGEEIVDRIFHSFCIGK